MKKVRKKKKTESRYPFISADRDVTMDFSSLYETRNGVTEYRSLPKIVSHVHVKLTRDLFL